VFTHFEFPDIDETDSELVADALLAAEGVGPIFGFRCDPRFGPFLVTVVEGNWVALATGESPTADDVKAYVLKRLAEVRAERDA
jgi:hypothetical protein